MVDNKWPWMVRIFFKNTSCTGTLVAERYVLSSEKCTALFDDGIVYAPPPICWHVVSFSFQSDFAIELVAVDASNTLTVRPVDCHLHRSDTANVTGNDLVLFEIPSFNASETLEPICLMADYDEVPGDVGFVVGFGQPGGKGSE